jgi:hypothetical protein
MQLLGVVLCGALLGVAHADSTVRLNAFDFIARVPMASLTTAALKVRMVKTNVNDRSTPGAWDCASPSFQYQSHEFRYMDARLRSADTSHYFFEIPDTTANDKTFVTGTGLTVLVPNLAGQFAFNATGKWKICGCAGTNCDTDPNTSPSPYTIDLGFLNVIDSVGAVGALSQNLLSSYIPSGAARPPQVILEGSPSSASLKSVQASWLLKVNGINANFATQNKLKVIFSDGFLTTDATPYEAGWQCGQEYPDGNATKPAIAMTDSLGITVTRTVSGYNDVDTATGAMLHTASPAEFNDRIESSSFDAPITPANHFVRGFMCYCDVEVEGDCQSNDRFSTALGAIVFRQFAVTHQTKHYTVRATTNQNVTLQSRNDLLFHSDDKLGLIRQDHYMTQPSSSWHAVTYSGSTFTYGTSGVGSQDNYEGYAHTRRCGWSNLDVMPGSASETVRYTKNQADWVVGANAFSESATFSFDFIQLFTARYQMCLCQASFINNTAWLQSDTRLAAVSVQGGSQSQLCPEPAMSHSLFKPTPYVDHNNAEGSFFNLFYAESAGYLHVVNTFAPAVRVVLQSETSSHISVNLMSRTMNGAAGRTRTADYKYYAQRETALKQSRFYISSGECGDAPTTHVTNMALVTDMYIRLKDTSGNFDPDTNNPDEKRIAWDPASSDSSNWSPSAPSSKWGSLWSLTTGWESDPFKPTAGLGSPTSAVTRSQIHSQSAGTRLYASALAEGQVFKVCMCDQFTEFPFQGIEAHLTITGATTVNDYARQERILPDKTCRSKAVQGDYSNFMAEVGTLKVTKFVFNNNSPKHYTVFKTTAQSFTMQVPVASPQTNPSLLQPTDKVSTIPFYGDGYGVDDADPRYQATAALTQGTDQTSAHQTFRKRTSSFHPQIDASLNKPWKTSYTCGVDIYATSHQFYYTNDAIWQNVKGTVIDVASASNEVVTAPKDFTSILQGKYQLCYCSSVIHGGCPTLADSAAQTTGFNDAVHYNDFAGYLHVVDANPANFDYRATYDTAVSTTYDLSFATGTTANKDQLFFVDASTTGTTVCGVSPARGASTNTLETGSGKINQTNSPTVTVNTPEYSDTPSALALTLCYCFATAERVEEYTTSVCTTTTDAICQDTSKTSCDTSSLNSFGAEIGGFRIQKFVTKRAPSAGFGRHYTVVNVAGEQTIAITDYDAGATLATTATTGNATKADHVGFMRVQDSIWGAQATLNAVCGSDPLKNSGVVVDVATQTTAELKTAGFNFVVRGFQTGEIARVCYCQVSLLPNGAFCTYSKASHWYDLGYLHMVDMAVWPQSWILGPIGVSTTMYADQTTDQPKYQVTFNDGASYPSISVSKFAISGAGDAGALRCGDNNGIPSTQLGNATFYTSNFIESGAITGDGVKETVFDLSSVVETQGEGDFRWVCMCENNEYQPSENLRTNGVKCTTLTTYQVWSDFGSTIGKVYLAKTLSLPPTINSDDKYYVNLKHHFTVSKGNGDQSFEFVTVASATPSQAVASTSDTVAFVGQDDACGSISVAGASPIISSTSTKSTVTVTPSAIVSALAPFTSRQAYMFKICICRIAIVGSCTEAWQFPETLGYLHIVDVTAASFQPEFSRHSGSAFAITVNFASGLTNGLNDRFMVIPEGLKCGQYDKAKNTTGQFHLDNPAGKYNLEANFYNNKNGYVGWTANNNAGLKEGPSGHRYFEAAVRPKDTTFNNGRNLDYLSRYAPTVDVTQTQLITPTMFFLGKANFKLCYCSASALSGSKACPSRSPTETDPTVSVFGITNNQWDYKVLVEHFQTYGAELGIIHALVFLTQTSTESSTIYSNEPDAQIRITKTSPPKATAPTPAPAPIGAVNLDVSKDYWGIVSSSGTCGSQTTQILRYGTFTASVSATSFRNNGWMSVCNGGTTPDGTTATVTTPPSGYECTSFYTKTNANSFVSLTAGKYKLCLCSADGTSANGQQCQYVSSAGASDFGDQAGYLNVLPGTASSYAGQTAMVNVNDATATISIQFDTTASIATTDRFAVMTSDHQCGDDGFSRPAIFTGGSLDTATYSVSNGRLTAGPLTYSTAGVYKICYCSTALEGTCAGSALSKYGITAGTLIVSDLKFGDSGNGFATVWSVPQRANTSLTLHYGMALPAQAEIQFLPATSPCTSSAGGTPNITLTGSGSALTIDFSQIYATKTFYRVCISNTAKTVYRDYSGLGVWVSDVALLPKYSQQVLADVALTYSSSLSYGTDYFWFRLSTKSCDPAPSLETGTTDSTGLHAVGGSGAFVTGVDMRNLAPSPNYRLCTGSSCMAGSCASYYDFQNVRLSVLGILEISPTAVAPAANTVLTLEYDVSVLGSYTIWFQRETNTDGTAYPCITTPPASTGALHTNSVQISSTVTLDFSSASASQAPFRLCGKKTSGASQSFAPVGVTIADVVVSPRTVSQKVAPIKIASNNILYVGDTVFFMLRTHACGTVAPTSVSANVTNAVVVTTAAADATYDFDFSQMPGECRLCVIPKGSVGHSIDLDGYVAGTLETRVAVADISLDRTSVKAEAGQSIVITYGAGTMSPAGLVWFQSEAGSCNKPSTQLNSGGSGSNFYSSTESAPASGNALSFDFTSVAESQSMLSLCFLASGGTTPQAFHSVGVFVTDAAVSPSSVLKASNQEVVLTFKNTQVLSKWDRIQFRHSSISCAASSYPSAFASSTMLDLTANFIEAAVSGCPVAMVQGATTQAPSTRAPTTEAPTTSVTTQAPTTGSPSVNLCDYRCTTNFCVIGDFDFADATVDASPYRLCVHSTDGSYIADYDIVELYVVDVAVRPGSVKTADLQQVTFTNVGLSNVPDASTLAQGDKIWFTSDTSNPCLNVPALATASNTNVQTFVSTQAVYPFDFSAATDNDFSLCVQSGTSTRHFGGISVLATGTTAVETDSGSESTILQKGRQPSGFFDIKVTSSFLSTASNDRFFFQVQSQAACNSSHTGSKSTAVATNVVAFTGSANVHNVSFLNIPASAGALRMCVVRDYSSAVKKVLDVGSVSLSIADVTLATTSVFNLANQPVSIDVTSGIEVGDQVFFVAGSGGSASCLSSVPSISSGSTTAGVTVLQINNGTLHLSLNFEQFTGAAGGSSTTLCVASPGQLPLSFGDGPKLYSKGADILEFRLARRAEMQTKVYHPVVSNFKAALVDSLYPCDLVKTDSAHFVGTNVTAEQPFSTFTFQLGSARLANRLLRLCMGDSTDPTSVSDYSSVGVIVSDITVMNSKSDSTVSVGCVSPQAAQSIAFTQNSLLSFDADSRFFFKRSTSADKTCGIPPAVSSVTSSATTEMIHVGTVGGSQSWSLEFDFTNAQPSFDVYRLCVQLPSGAVLDYHPLGVRVSTAVVATVTPGGSSGASSVKPLAGQQLSISFPSTMLTSALKVWFIDSTNSYLECQCTETGSNTCNSPYPNSGVTDQVTISSTSIKTFNFSSFASNPQPAKMCVSPSAGVSHTLGCITVAFDVAVAPSSVPGNTGQLVQLSFSGGTLAQGDIVMFAHPQFACSSSVNFTTAHTTSPTGYSSSATVGASGAFLSFDMDGMHTSQNVDAVLCVYDTASGTVFSVPGATIEVTARVVGIAGDPHVRSASGAWLDFYGDAGVYELLAGDSIQANAKFGFAIRDNFMIWHPKVMRPGTLIEEVGIQLNGAHTSLRLGIQGGGIVSVREEAQTTDFWARDEDHKMQAGDYTITWSKCRKDCDVVMPWGSHQRSQSLIVEGRGEFLQMFVTKSGGYRFIDVEAIPSPVSTGLLADAASDPYALASLLLGGGEAAYKAHVPMLHS